MGTVKVILTMFECRWVNQQCNVSMHPLYIYSPHRLSSDHQEVEGNEEAEENPLRRITQGALHPRWCCSPGEFFMENYLRKRRKSIRNLEHGDLGYLALIQSNCGWTLNHQDQTVSCKLMYVVQCNKYLFCWSQKLQWDKIITTLIFFFAGINCFISDL